MERPWHICALLVPKELMFIPRGACTVVFLSCSATIPVSSVSPSAMLRYGVPISFCLSDRNSVPTCISKFLMKVHHMYCILWSKRHLCVSAHPPLLMILWFMYISVTRTNGCLCKHPPPFLLTCQFQAPMGAYSREYGTHINPIQKLITDLILKQIHVS